MWRKHSTQFLRSWSLNILEASDLLCLCAQAEDPIPVTPEIQHKTNLNGGETETTSTESTTKDPSIGEIILTAISWDNLALSTILVLGGLFVALIGDYLLQGRHGIPLLSGKKASTLQAHGSIILWFCCTEMSTAAQNWKTWFSFQSIKISLGACSFTSRKEQRKLETECIIIQGLSFSQLCPLSTIRLASSSAYRLCLQSFCILPWPFLAWFAWKISKRDFAGLAYALLFSIGINFVRSVVSVKWQTRCAWENSPTVKSYAAQAESFVMGFASVHDKYLSARDPALTLKVSLSAVPHENI